MAGAFVAALVQAHRLDDGPLASRSGHLGSALYHLDPATGDGSRPRGGNPGRGHPMSH